MFARFASQASLDRRTLPARRDVARAVSASHVTVCLSAQNGEDRVSGLDVYTSNS